MKLILSRKGFDSRAGGCANLILPDGRLVPLPIPDRASSIRYEQISLAGLPLGKLVPELTGSKQKPHFGAHLDPDLAADAYPRAPGWRPLFGQAGSAQAQLQREGVGPGDLFLFFGWFRQVEECQGRFRFVRKAPDIHLLWGWLQVDRVLVLEADRPPVWAAYHPHVSSAIRRQNNCLYIAGRHLRLGHRHTGLPGAGLFRRFHSGLQLTKAGASRSLWSIPAWFVPTAQRPALSYHKEPSRWSLQGDRVELRSVGRGQEFVLNIDHYPEVLDWIVELISADGHR